MTATASLTRRRFLQFGLTAGGALLVGFRNPAMAAAIPAELLGDDLVQLTAFVMIERDNRVVIGARGCETGQGVITALPMLIAEELDVDWSKVRVIQLPYGYEVVDGKAGNRYGNQSAGSSTSIAEAWIDLREAGAAARWLLVQAAAAAWSVDADSLRTESGHVVNADGRKLSYGALARTATSRQLPDAPIPTKDPATFKLVGKPTRTVDGRSIVTGRNRYGIDEYLSGALVAVMLLLEGVAVSHTPDPRLNNAWTRRQTGVLASFINEDVASTKPCIHKGDTVIVVPFMPALYSMTPEIEPPENASDYWVTSLPREVRKAPYDTIEGSDVDVVITSSPLRVAYERTAVARVQSSWTQCALWQPIGLGLSHPPFEVFVRP